MVLATHSWGDNVCRAFFYWIDSIDENWVEYHLETYINLAGPVLGVPKSVPAFLSGKSPVSITLLGSKKTAACELQAVFLL